MFLLLDMLVSTSVNVVVSAGGNVVASAGVNVDDSAGERTGFSARGRYCISTDVNATGVVFLLDRMIEYLLAKIQVFLLEKI